MNDPSPDLMFDAHAHIITDDAASYPPSPISGRLRPGVLDNPMTAERLIEAMDSHAVKRAALVQRAHVYGYDNSYVVDAAARYPDRFGAICVIDSVATGAAARAADWMDRGAVGIRLTEPMKDADSAWLNGGEALKVWEAVAERKGTISIQLYTWNRADRLPEIPRLAAAFETVPVIVEHLSNIAETANAPHFGVDPALDALAGLKNIVLKLTTINLARCRTNEIDAAAFLARLASSFTYDRLIWGSDVAQSPQSYEDMTGMVKEAIAGLDHEQRRAVLFKTAEKLFVR
jgi:L-fuconolactonase